MLTVNSRSYLSSKLPPYVFNVVNELKAAARARGEDIVDMGMGNPDLPTPAPIVNKLIEAGHGTIQYEDGRLELDALLLDGNAAAEWSTSDHWRLQRD